jgi:serine phosphatase RsbU (regulator of sigma subunit)
MFSDGVTEACRPGTEEDFGEMRLAQVLAAQPLQSAEGLVQTAMDALQEWTGDESYADDVTLVIARRTN